MRELTQERTASMLSMSRSYYIRVEHGQQNISLDNLAKLANGFGVSIADLVEGIDGANDL